MNVIGFVGAGTGPVVDVVRFRCIRASGPPAQLIGKVEIPSSAAVVTESEISPVPPICVIRAPGIRALSSAVEGSENCEVPEVSTVLLNEGATNEGLSTPMQGANGRMSGDGAAAARLPGCIAPEALVPEVGVDTELDVADDGIEPVVDVGIEPHATEALDMPGVAAPEVAAMPDIPLEPPPEIVDAGSPAATGMPVIPPNPPPSKIGSVVLGDALKQGLESLPISSGDVAGIAGRLAVGLVCAKPAAAPSRNNPVVGSRMNKATRLQPA